MSKRNAPLLYIYQPKEVEVEAINQEFVYKKFKVHVEVKPSVDNGEYTLDPQFEKSFTEQMTILEKLEFIIASPNKVQEVQIEAADEVHRGYLQHINSDFIILLSGETEMRLNVLEITSVHMSHSERH